MATPSSYRRIFLLLASILGAVLLSCELLRAQTPEVQASPIEGTLFTPSFQWMPQTKMGELFTSLHLTQVVDDNTVLTPAHGVLGTYSNLEGLFTYSSQQVSRSWMLSYRSGGRIYSPRFSSLDGSSNDVRLQAQQRVSSRMSVSFNVRWANVLTTGFEQPTPGQTFPSHNSEDENLPFLLGRQKSMESAVVLGYKLSKRTSLAWGGNYYDYKFAAASLIHSRTTGAYGTINYRLTRGQTIGFGYLSQWISFPGGPSRSRVDNFLATYSNQLTPTLEVSSFGGPALLHQVVALQPGVGSGSDLQRNLVGGIALTKQVGHNSFMLRYDRMYSRSSILFATTLRQSASLSYSKRFSSRLEVSVGGNYTRNALGKASAAGYSSHGAQSAIHYDLGPRVRLTVSDGYTRALGNSLLGGLGRNVFQLGFDIDLPNLAVGR